MKTIILLMTLITSNTISAVEISEKIIDKQCSQKITGELYLEGSENEVYIPSGGFISKGKWQARSLLDNELIEKENFNRVVFLCKKNLEITITKENNENFRLKLSQKGMIIIDETMNKKDSLITKLKEYEMFSLENERSENLKVSKLEKINDLLQ